MSTIYKLFIEVIKLFLPKLDLGSMMVGLILKLIFAAITATALIGGGVYVKNKYNDWKTAEARADAAQKQVGVVTDINEGVIEDIGKTKESGAVDVSTVVDNVKATDEIGKKTEGILKELDNESKDIAAGKNTKPKTPKKQNTAKTDKPTTPQAEDPPRTQSDANIDAMWTSYCTLGGNATACAANS